MSAMWLGAARDRIPDEAFTLGALLSCDAHDKAVAYRAVMEATGPRVVRRVVYGALATGRLLPPPARGEMHAAHAVLDVLDADGDILVDFTIPHIYAWEWWVRVVELRPVSSDCELCEPAAYAAARVRA